MSIDLHAESVGTLAEVAAQLPRLSGRRIHVSTLWRWATKGIKGVRLDYIKMGGRLVTSVEAVARFAAKLTENDQKQAENDQPALQKARKKRTPTQHDRDVASARLELERAGIR